MARLLMIATLALLGAGGTAWAAANSTHFAHHAGRKAHRRMTAAARPHRRLFVEMSDWGHASRPAMRTVSDTSASSPPRLSVAQDFGSAGLVGSLGVNHAPAGQRLDAHAVNNAAATQFGQPDTTVGAKVSMPF